MVPAETSTRRVRRPRGAPVIVFGTLALISILGLRQADVSLASEARPSRALHLLPPDARAGATALGRSGGVRMRFALAGDRVDFPLQLQEAPDSLTYRWVPLGRTALPDSLRPLTGALRAPTRAGFYNLTIAGAGGERVVDGITLAVLVPFSAKRGALLNGYRIGMYRGERRGQANAPTGFLEVAEGDVALPVSAHLSVADFLTRDEQTVWPRYAALDPRLLDKLELVFAEIASWHGGSERAPVEVNVHSGFRTPVHNRAVARAAGDSRHQFGDAADVIVDANRDGRITAKDVKLIALAVEVVEREHPDLVGGLGQYTRNGAPYAHIDTRGSRVRWQG
ncbi:MAG: DUF882 domain-containing protein [Gemmatimonadaceae bacterium]